MLEQFKSYFVKLRRLSSAELDRSAEKMVVAENGNISKLIALIAEMSARKLALELGYKNLYDYCVRRLNLSEGAVPARIHVANVSRRFPQLLVYLDGLWPRPVSVSPLRVSSPLTSTGTTSTS